MDTERDRRALRRRALGWGIATAPIFPGVDLGRDLVLARGPGGLDFARVEGEENLAHALEVAMTTPLGSDLFNTSFGFDGLNALAGETDPVLVRERVRVSVIRTLRGDPRVRRILDVQLGGESAGSAAGTRALHVHVAFETVTGENATLDLGRIAPHA